MPGNFVVENLNLDNLRFDNVSHYLTTTTCPANDSKYVFSGDFTIEAWINMTTLPATAGTAKTIISSYTNSGANRSFWFGINNFNGQQFLQLWWSTDGLNWLNLNSSGNSGTVSAPYTFQAATWYHVVASRSGNNYNLFVNGFLVGQYIAASAVANFAGPIPVTIGLDPQFQTYYFNGYISNLRVVNGIAVYNAPTPGTTYYANSTVSYINPNPSNTRSFIPPIIDLTATQSAGDGINAIGGNSTVNTSLLVCQSPSSGSYTAAFVDNSSYVQKINAVGYIPNVNRITGPALPYPGYFATTFAAGALTTSVTSAGFAFGTGDFTVEGWIYPTSLVSGAGIIGSWTGTAATSNWIVTCGVTNTSALRLITCNAGTTINAAVESSAGALVVNVWQHIAVVRISGSISMYVNGVLVYGPVANTTNFSVTQTCQMGAVNTLAPFFVGSMSNMRVTKATGIYTGNFKPQFNPLLNTQASGTNIAAVGAAVAGTSGVQLLACRYRTLTPEYSVNGFTLNNGGTAPTVTAYVAPNYLPTDNNLLNIQVQPKANDVGPNFLIAAANTNFNLGTGAFTIEGWVHPTNLAQAPNIISSVPSNLSGAGFWKLGLTTGGFLTFNYDGPFTSINATSQALITNAWSHVAVTRTITGANGVYTFYVNGVAATNTVIANSTVQTGNSTTAIWVGSQQYTGPTGTFTGLTNNIRITRGIAVYTGAFTPPSANLGTTQSSGTNIAAIASSANVVLLIQANSSGHIADASPTAATIDVYGNPSSNTYGAATVISNSVYVTTTRQYKQQTVAANIICNETHFKHLLSSTSSIAQSARLASARSDNALLIRKSILDSIKNTSFETVITRYGTIGMFDNKIVTNLYNLPPSQSTQFWS